jgi:hypothetical protein
MIDNVNRFFGTVADTELARAARRSARAIWNAHRAALETTRVEAGKVISLAMVEGRRFAARVQPAVAGHKATRRRPRRATRRAA